jgi:hypothetical protein
MGQIQSGSKQHRPFKRRPFMDKRKFIPIVLAGTLSLVLVFSVFTYQAVNAQAETPTPEVTEKPVRGGFKGGTSDEDLAAALGIEVEALQAAKQAAFEKALEQAVSQGLITQEQADRYATHGWGRFPMGGRGGSISGIDTEALLAAELGIRVEQLQAAQEQAFNASLARAVEDGRITAEQADLIQGQRALAQDSNFQNSMQSAFQAAVQQAVTDGVITQSQAEQILENSANGFHKRGGFDGLNFGGRGGRGGRMHPGLETPAESSSGGA